MARWIAVIAAASVFGLAQPAKASAPVDVAFEDLSAECKTAIEANAPNAAEEFDGPNVSKDARGDLSIGWASLSGAFFKEADGEAGAAQAIAKGCPAVAKVIFSGATGGTERWYIRHDGYAVRHFRDSGMPGDYDSYFGWETVPFDYDPNKDYLPD